MNRNVEVSVTGIHSREGEPTEKVIATLPGSFELLEDGRRLVEYDEDLDPGHEGMRVHNKVLIDARGETMEIIRAGATKSRLAFGDNMEYILKYLKDNEKKLK